MIASYVIAIVTHFSTTTHCSDVLPIEHKHFYVFLSHKIKNLLVVYLFAFTVLFFSLSLSLKALFIVLEYNEIMAGQTKLIIITSDENIIQQFSFNSTNNTQIIHLNNIKQTKSNQLTKRSLDSSDQKPVKTPRKSLNLTCLICGGRAIGFNYDVLSCASCKAFFRRNANVDKVCFSSFPCGYRFGNYLGDNFVFNRRRAMFNIPYNST